MFRARWLACGAILLLGAARLVAHHSLAEYRTSTAVELRGTIVRVDWVNPHTFIHVNVTAGGAAGATTWQVEAGTPSTLRKAKITRAMLAIGTPVTIKGWPAHNGTQRAFGDQITFADGTTRMLDLQPELTYRDWAVYSLPGLINHWIPYVVMATPVAVLLVGLYLWRSQDNKART